MQPEDPGAPEPTPEAVASDQPDAWAAQPASKPHRRRWIWISGITAAVLLLAGSASAFVMLRGSSEQLLSKIPARSDVVAVAYLNPSGGQKVNLLALANHFPSLGSSQQIHDQVNKSLDGALAALGLNHTDVSWVGSEVAIAADVGAGGAPSGALLLVTTDEAAARASLDKMRNGRPGDLMPSASSPASEWTTEEHGGVQVSVGPKLDYAVFDGVAVIGDSKSAVESIIDTSQGKLAALDGSSDFKATMADLPTGRLGFLYVGPGALNGFARSGSLIPTGLAGLTGTSADAVQGMAITLSAQPDGLQLDSSTRYDPSKLSVDQRARLSAPARSSVLLSSAPADAFAVITLSGLDKTIHSSLGQAGATAGQLPPGVGDLLDSLSGDVLLEVAPHSPGSIVGGPGAAIVFGSKNDALMQSSLDQIASAIPSLSKGSRWKTLTYNGTTVRYLSGVHTSGLGSISEVAPAYAVSSGKVIVATSVDALDRILDTAGGKPNISSNPTFIAASKSVPSGGTFVFIDVQSLLAQFQQLVGTGAGNLSVGPGRYIQPIKWIAIGSGSDATHERQRVFVHIS